jgi:hypothetical protein
MIVYKQKCEICTKEINFEDTRTENANEVIMFNTRQPDNIVKCVCSKACQASFVPGPCCCVICGSLCLSGSWYMHVKFVNLGGWTSVRTCCSEACRKTLIREETPDIDLRYQCWNCKKLSEQTPKRCGKCRLAYYCDQGCQRQHWDVHKSSCK